MSITRTARITRFTTVSNSIIDAGLSWQALGLLVYVLSKPDHWKISVSQLRAQVAESASPTGRDGTYAILNELMQAGYVRRSVVRGDGGKLSGWDYEFFDAPQPCSDEPNTAEPHTAEPNTAQPHTAKADSLVNTDHLVNTDVLVKTDARGARLSESWVLPDDWLAWALGEKPSWNAAQVRKVAEVFFDHWIAQPGAKGRKANWFAIWKNWIRREKSAPALGRPSNLSSAGERTLAAAEQWMRGE